MSALTSCNGNLLLLPTWLLMQKFARRLSTLLHDKLHWLWTLWHTVVSMARHLVTSSTISLHCSSSAFCQPTPARTLLSTPRLRPLGFFDRWFDCLELFPMYSRDLQCGHDSYSYKQFLKTILFGNNMTSASEVSWNWMHCTYKIRYLLMHNITYSFIVNNVKTQLNNRGKVGRRKAISSCICIVCKHHVS